MKKLLFVTCEVVVVLVHRIICWLSGHRTIKDCDGVHWVCVRCEDMWLIEVDDSMLGEAIEKWLNDEAFIRTDIP